MAILYFWVRENYLEDKRVGLRLTGLEQNAHWLAQAKERGEPLWAFTRNSRGDYVLALRYQIRAIRHIGAEGNYGAYEILAQKNTVTWFDTEKGSSVEPIIRKLSIAPKAQVLGRSFQGDSAIRRISAADEQKLAAFAETDRGFEKLSAHSAASQQRASLSRGAAIIRWRDADGWDDFLPLHFFRGGQPRVVAHLIRRVDDVSTARCVLTVSANEMQLDYADVAVNKFNDAVNNDAGIVRLRFLSSRLEGAPTVDWYDSATGKWTLNEGEFSWPNLTKLKDYRLPVGGKAKRRLAPAKERPGQKRFRMRLSDAYGTVCLLTGCTVEEAIDGAHIDPYEGKEFDHPQNGLLLRKDLHCLFDNNLLGIEPTTHVAYFGTAAAQIAYAELHEKCRLAPPHALFSDHAPSHAALERRWKTFCQAHGDPRAK